MRTSNPALSSNVYKEFTQMDMAEERMTVRGACEKSLLLIGLCLLSASWIWSMFFEGKVETVSMLMMPAVIVGFIVAVVTMFKKQWANVTAPIYALVEGVALGAISCYAEVQYPGVAIEAVSLTFMTLILMLVAYRFEWIRVTDKFRMGLFAATGAVGLIYLVSWVLSFFSISVPFITGNSMMSIGFSFIVVGIAALNLVLDFEFIVQGEQKQAPKRLEWYAAFGLMVTLVWLYLEMLRLLSKLRSRR
jgi:uncharacterized YccA/Bax inhibitor family protein